MHNIIIPSKSCDGVLSIDSSSNILQDYRQLLVRPNAQYWALYEHGTHPDCPEDPSLARSQGSRRTKKCFQTDFKQEFSGVLDRTFSSGFTQKLPMSNDSTHKKIIFNPLTVQSML